MFYKITDQESELYKKLHELRSNELKIEKENDAAVKKLVGDDWDHFSGWLGQQNFFRVTIYSGFAFKHPENLTPKTWKKHKEYDDIYVPDRRFTFPYIEICDDETIVLFVDDKFDLEKKFQEVVEVTKKEANELLKGGEK